MATTVKDPVCGMDIDPASVMDGLHDHAVHLSPHDPQNPDLSVHRLSNWGPQADYLYAKPRQLPPIIKPANSAYTSFNT